MAYIAKRVVRWSTVLRSAERHGDQTIDGSGRIAVIMKEMIEVYG